MNQSANTHSQHRVAKARRNMSNLIFIIKKIKNQKKWTKDEDEMLISLAEKFSEKNWKEISKRFLKKNSLQCFSRYKRIRPGIIKGSWKKEEDHKIIDLVEKHGKSWSKISKLLGTRNGKQIRDRYINVLDPEIRKGKFTEEEDQILIELYRQNGPKWATIAKCYPNRTADMIKNRFHSSIKKRLTDEEKTPKDDYAYRKETTSTLEESMLSPKHHTPIQNIPRRTLVQAPELMFPPIEEIFSNDTNACTYDKQIDGLYKEMEPNYFMPNTSLFDVLINNDDKYDDCQYGANSAFNFNFDDYFTM